MSANYPLKYTDQTDDGYVIDEDDSVEAGLTIITPPEPPPKQRGHRYKYTPERIDGMLVRAGYDPSRIPESLRITALEDHVVLGQAHRRRGRPRLHRRAQAQGRTRGHPRASRSFA